MLRVAGVCQMICDHWSGTKIDRNTLISAALLHDMGNLVKYTFDITTNTILQWLDTKELKKQQKIMIEKYGDDDHAANIAICKELEVDKNIIKLVDAVEFNNLSVFTLEKNILEILLIYSDLRVWPFGILSILWRLEEAFIRYKRIDRLWEGKAALKLWTKHENIIFAHCSILPTDIHDESITPLLEHLRWFDIVTTLWT